jgi:hypothetical protein
MHQPLQEKSLPPRERVQELANKLADCDSEDDDAYGRAWENLQNAAEEWVKGIMRRRGGEATAKALSAEERSAGARKAARARWARARAR